ncbi:PKD domain-containing protein [Lentimicrobium sp. L6]|uniref:PKD domain-containing protein n=1 Tax=Lentimicrobium sp. L6 TaxID=2735916 RepID=UPI0015522B52|nr:PKD domain-containing protein [Lentimicrobium sp. L6]NPD83162.1 PKD domain-containing protein [Lentimicrobium sp. L6]
MFQNGSLAPIYKNKSILQFTTGVSLSRLACVFYMIMFLNVNSFGQNFNCIESWLICTYQTVTYPGGLDFDDAEIGPDYACLNQQRNPAWFHMQIEQVGDIELNIYNPDEEDVDFICWGPFDSPYGACTDQLASINEVDCSYSYTWNEYCNIPSENMNVGDYYILVVMNYSQDPCTVTIEKSDGAGETACSDMIINPSSNSPVCEGNTIELYASPDGGSYTWLGPNDYISTEQNPIITNATEDHIGTYTLHVSTSEGSSNPTSIFVDVSESAVADYSFTSACAQQATQFTDLSTSNSEISWSWDFGDGHSSTEQNPEHIYSYSGVFEVTLTIDNGGCIDNITKSVTVTEIPTANFSYSFDNGVECGESEIQFTDESLFENTVTWNWDFGDGNISNIQNPTYTYFTGGIYTVTLTIENENACSHSISQSISIYEPPNIYFSFTEDCENQATFFNDSDHINMETTTSWFYEFGDNNTSSQSNPSHVYDAPGDYNVTFSITDENGCSNSITRSVKVFHNPIANFSNNTVCEGKTTLFNNLSYCPSSYTPVNSWYWDFGDGNTSIEENPSHTYSIQNNNYFNVTLTVETTAGCSSSLSKTVEILESPQTEFSYQFNNGAPCQFSEIQFIDESTSSQGNIETWNWFFGNGDNSNQQNPNYTYTNSGTYSVELRVGNSGGCYSNSIQTIEIIGSPEVDFSFTEVCLGSTTDFIDSDYSNSSEINSWSYEFGDGNTGNSSDPSHTYTSTGEYFVHLEVFDIYGCSNSVSHSLNVFEVPVADFSYDLSCQSNPTHFTDLSTIISQSTPINQWSWSFGDGGSSSNQNPSYIYPPTSVINYNVSLEVGTSEGCTNSISKPVEVLPSPHANFNYEALNGTFCPGGDISFTDLSTSLSYDITNWYWNFGDSNFSTVTNPIHEYDSPGTYNVTLTVTNSASCIHVIQKQIIINLAPEIDFSFTPACLGSSTLFTDSDFIDVENTSVWAYDFGDGNFSNQSDPSHSYSTSGDFNVIFSITDINGCQNAIDHIVPVYENPISEFSFDTICFGAYTNFNDLSSSDVGITTWEWDFGDGNISSVSSPTHLYTQAGLYTVTLLVENENSCIDQVTHSVWVKNNPISDFSFSYTDGGACENTTIHFSDNSEAIEGNIASWNWSFGDGNYSEEPNPFHIYSIAGNHNVTLSVMNSIGCSNTIQIPIQIYENPEVDFSYTEACLGTPTEFNDSDFINMGAISIWDYDFGDGLSSNYSNPTHEYTTDGEFIVNLSIIDTNNCTNNKSHMVPVYNAPITNFRSDTVCFNTPTSFTDLSQPQSAIDFWIWNFGDTETSTEQNPNHLYNNPGYYEIQLIAGNDAGCSDTITKTAWVWEPPVANFISSDTACTEGLVYFCDSSYSNENNINYLKWNFPDGHISFDPETYFVFLDIGYYYDVSLLIKDERGCRDSITKNIFIKPELQIGFQADTVCFGDTTELSTFIIKPDEDSISYYTWEFQDGSPQLISTNNKTLHKFINPGEFEVTLQATNINGCIDEVRKQVKIWENPISSYQFTESYCNDSSIFTDESIAADTPLTYWKWNYGDGEHLEIHSPNSPDHFHHYPPLYGAYHSSLYIQDINGCSDISMQEINHYPCVLVHYYNDTNWICQNTPAVFIDSTYTNSDYSITSKAIYFGDGSMQNIPVEQDTIYYQYQYPGNYQTKLLIKYQIEDLIIKDSSEKEVEILASPQVSFSVNEVCYGQISEFQNESSINNAEFEWVSWNLGNGVDSIYQYSPGANTFSYLYNEDGPYNVQLKMTANNNCSDSLLLNTTIHPKPKIGFFADSTIHCGEAKIQFIDTSYINTGTIAERLWIFGDGAINTTNRDTVYHIYEEGIYNVKLENISDHFCKSILELEDYLLINPIIDADFLLDPEEISVSNSSEIEVTNLVNEDPYIRWLLSDTIVWENTYEPHIGDSIYDTGYYSLKLITMNDYGCQDTMEKFFYVFPVYNLYVPSGFSPNGNGINETFGPIGKYFEMESYDLKIYNRWGKLFFHSQDYFHHWDGKMQDGTPADIGSYAWIIRVKDLNGNHKVMKGSVTLLL